MKRYMVLLFVWLTLSAGFCLAGGSADYSKEVNDFKQALDGFKNSGLPELFKDVLSKGADALVALINSPDCEQVSDADIEAAADQLSEIIGQLSSSCEGVGAGGEEAAIDLDTANRAIAQKAHDTDVSLKAAKAEMDQSIVDLIASVGKENFPVFCSVRISSSYDPPLRKGTLFRISTNKFQKFDLVAKGYPPDGTYRWGTPIVIGKTASGKAASDELKLVGRESGNVFAGVHLEGKFGVEDGRYRVSIGVTYFPHGQNPDDPDADSCEDRFELFVVDPPEQLN